MGIKSARANLRGLICARRFARHWISPQLRVQQLSMNWIKGGVLQSKGWLDKLWTRNPNFVQLLSNYCPTPVQFLSRYTTCPHVVQVLSNSCPIPVQIANLGQRLDIHVQGLSKLCPTRWPAQLFKLDKLWTNFGHGQTLDKLWTGQTLDTSWIFVQMHTNPNFVQPLSRPKNEPVPHLKVDKVWTKFGLGQTLDMDKLWTAAGFLSSKHTNPNFVQPLSISENEPVSLLNSD